MQEGTLTAVPAHPSPLSAVLPGCYTLCLLSLLQLASATVTAAAAAAALANRHRFETVCSCLVKQGFE